MMSKIKLQDASLQTRLDGTIDLCKNIWADPLVLHYTKHGVDHSQRIEERLDKILPLVSPRLCDAELFVLLNAVYLHDIGMQHSKEACPDKSIDQLTYDDYERIRKIHHRVSAKWIKGSAKGNREYSFLGLHDDHYYNLIAKVSQYHTKTNLLEVEDVIPREGVRFRIRLLAALLIIGDELDLDSRRVKITRLREINIPQESKLHWWKHHYVDLCDVQDGRIRIEISVPMIYEGLDARALYREVVNPLKKQLDGAGVCNALESANVKLELEPPVIRLDEEGTKQQLPSDVVLFPREEVREDDIRFMNAQNPENILPILDSHFYGLNPTLLNDDDRIQLFVLNQQLMEITRGVAVIKSMALIRAMEQAVDGELKKQPVPAL